MAQSSVNSKMTVHTIIIKFAREIYERSQFNGLSYLEQIPSSLSDAEKIECLQCISVMKRANFVYLKCGGKIMDNPHYRAEMEYLKIIHCNNETELMNAVKIFVNVLLYVKDFNERIEPKLTPFVNKLNNQKNKLNLSV